MGRIQASTGLATGIDIQGTVQKLMQVESIPHDDLVSRQTEVKAEQAAVTDLTATAIGVQLAVQGLKKPALFNATTINSSNPNVLTASTASSVAPGQYQFIPAQLAQASNVVSSGLASSDGLIGTGSLSFRFGGQVDTPLLLGELNGGAGVARGQIRITDRSGGTGVVDLRFAQTIDDVVNAINNSGTVSVSASVDGDHLVLTDRSGGSGNLRVQEVGSGTTAADLGLSGINAATNQASGQNVVRLFNGLQLNTLRDGNGLSLRPAVPELSVTFHDGSTRQIDLDPTGVVGPKTLGDVLNRLNTVEPTKLKAQISADGKRIELTDLTSGGGNFTVADSAGGSVATELGLAGTTAGNTLSGSRIVSGLATTLISSLNGGAGLGTLGAINLTDRSGATASVNLAGADTLDDVIDRINQAGLRITASYNQADNGIALTDTSGASTSNLIVANGDATNSAAKLGIAANVAATTIDSGNLDRQSVSRATLLSSYNGGQGVGTGTFKITNSQGATGTINLATLKPTTIGDVIDAINNLGLHVAAQINTTGDGIVLTDSAGGSGTLSAADQGTGKSAANLHLTGAATGTTLDGSTTIKIDVTNTDTLDSLVQKINDLGVGVTANALNDGSGSLPTHLSLIGNVTGSAAGLVIDGSSLGLTFHELTKAQDAVLQVGASTTGGSLITSATNTFKSIVPGLDVTLSGASTDVVTVSATQSSDNAASALQLFVDQYNKLRDKLDTYTSYNAQDGTTGTLFGSNETLHLDSDLANAVGATYFNDGSVNSLAELGVTIGQDGHLTFDKTVFQAAYNANPTDVTDFFTQDKRGFAIQTDSMLESLVGQNNSLLVTREDALQAQNDDYTTQINAWNTRLSNIQDSLLNEFYQMESIVSSIKANASAISQIQYIPPAYSTSTASSGSSSSSTG
ncbi:MAG TPA: flagellar filament capping protein FliD [Pirellulaceae bacterium]|jgi:flagellar hook-associated protein 2